MRNASYSEHVRNTVLKTTCYVCKCPFTKLWGLQDPISNHLHDINVLEIVLNDFRLLCTTHANAHITTYLTVGLAASNSFLSWSKICNRTIIPTSSQ